MDTLRPSDPSAPARQAHSVVRRLAVAALAVIATSIASVAAAGVAGAADTGAPWGHVSQVTVAKGIASVSGDAVDPDSSDPIRVALTLDGHHVQTVTADRFSKTIAKYHPNLGPNHGYTADVPLPDGRHQLCVIALNVGDGTNTELGCAPVEGANDPVGAILSADRAATGTQLTVTGWTLDPNVVTPITASVVVDGQTVATPTASADATLPPAWSSYGSGHGFTATIPISASAHTVCVTGGNLGAGADADLGCRDVAAFVTAPGIPPKIAAKSTSTSTSVTWIAPENGGAAITRFMVSATSAGEGADTITASAQARSATLSGLRPSTKYSVSVAAVNTAGTGQSATTTVETTAAPVVHRTHPPRHHRHHRLRHTHRHHRVHRHHRTHRHHHARRHHSVHRTHRHHRVHRTHRHHHARRHHTVHRSHRHHRSQHGTIPLQRTPAPVSTSHYLRNLTGNAAHDTHVMRVMGATDARYNPSGHRYLVLQDIGAQYGNGVILSATVKYVSYGDLVKSLKAYVSGYRSAQKSRAPLTLAIGTNNDGRVSRSAGRAWANRVVDPVRAFAGKYHVRVAGADDIEPGFTAGVGASRAWLRGYLSATKAEFVFNGSADGCPTGRGSRCNNGWTVGDLHFLSGGAAPGQIISLPQIYNTAMPLQWRVISGVGTHKVRFGGPLTEYTACRQVGSCSSASNVSAWSMLFHVLAQRPRTAQRAMPYGTDLRIN